MSEMSMKFSHPLMAPVVELALQAGEAILPFWRSGVEVTAKSDDSPVTAAARFTLPAMTAQRPARPRRLVSLRPEPSSKGWELP